MTRARDRASGDFNGQEIIIDADADTSITADTDDQIDVHIAGADDFQFTANTFNALDGSTVLVGGGSSRTVGGVTAALQVEGTAINDSSISMISNGASGTDGLPAKLVFGRSGAASLGSSTVVEDGNEIGVISFQAGDGTDLESQAASILVAVDGSPGGNDTPGRMVFSTTADGSAGSTEAMRLTNAGHLCVGRTDFSFDNNSGFAVAASGSNEGQLHSSTAGQECAKFNRKDSDGNGLVFARGSTNIVGSINFGTGSVSYNTTSDYRLKENVDYSWTATTRLKQLKPCRFNFTADSDNTLVDGFLAHEVSSIVPEAITGDKDATKTETSVVKNASGGILAYNIKEADWTAGKAADPQVYPSDSTWHASAAVPDYQSIDQSKLVPLLVKTVQELEARITALEG